jgi:hypothetical protein
VTAPKVTFSESDDLDEVLDGIRRALSAHPIAAQAAFSALVAEGRAFSKTAEGKVLLDRLASSDLVERLRVLWSGVAMNSFVERGGDVLPSHYLDGALRAISRAGLEPLLSALFDGGD